MLYIIFKVILRVEDTTTFQHNYVYELFTDLVVLALFYFLLVLVYGYGLWFKHIFIHASVLNTGKTSETEKKKTCPPSHPSCCSSTPRNTTSRTMQSNFRTVIHKLSTTFAAATVKTHPPVTRLETTRGKISIFSILIRISPGKAMIIITSAGRGDMCRSSIPAMEPRKTPEPQRTRKWVIKPGDSEP